MMLSHHLYSVSSGKQLICGQLIEMFLLRVGAVFWRPGILVQVLLKRSA